MKDLLGLKDLSAAEITEILSVAADMKKLLLKREKSDCLKNKNVVTLFYENSTRTRTSFEAAAKALSATTASISASTSSIQKGETLLDTGRTLKALNTDAIIMRHSMGGAPRLLAENVDVSVINAGDGMNEHPTQALLDFLTMQEVFGSFEGLRVLIVGDAKHSRVVRSNIWGLNKLGAKVTVCGPSTLLPVELEKMGCKVTCDLDGALDGQDVVMGLRLQLERQSSGLIPGGEYHDFFGITEERLKRAAKNAVIMHPGPINRGYELSGGAADCEESKILAQVTNGIAVRMAVLYLLIGRK